MPDMTDEERRELADLDTRIRGARTYEEIVRNAPPLDQALIDKAHGTVLDLQRQRNDLLDRHPGRGRT